MTEQEFWEIMSGIPEPTAVLFRLYYDDNGCPIEYTHEDKDGNYIDLDPETFRLQAYNIRVINGQIIPIDLMLVSKKLVPGPNGTACDPTDVCVIINKEPNTKWSLKTYEPY